MEKENLKIQTYENGVENLPNYPSDAGYTAEMLKAVFDARSNKEIKEKHNALCDATAEIFETLKTHCENEENPHGVTKEQIGAGGVRVVLSTDDLSVIIPEKDEVYFIKYENLRYKDGDGNIKTSEKVIYTMKTGDGVTSLALLPTMQNIVPSEGVGSLAQFVEEEAEGYMTGGVFYLPASFAEGYAAVALGRYNKVIGKNSMAVNYNNEVAARDAFAANSGNKITENAEGAIVAGHANEANGAFQAVFGTYADVGENDAFVIGNGNANGRKNAFKVTKTGDATAAGRIEAQSMSAPGMSATNMTVYGNLTVAKKATVEELEARGKAVIGSGAVSAKHSSFGENIATGRGSVTFGGNNKVYGEVSAAFHTSNTIPEGLSQVFVAGHANVASASHQAIFGTYADPKTTDSFVVGNGNSAGRKNAFAIDRSGNVRIGGNLNVGSTTLTEADIKALKALITNQSVASEGE